MTNKVPLGALGVHSATDLCVLDPNPPPLSFKTDFDLPDHAAAPAVIAPKSSIDAIYWGPR